MDVPHTLRGMTLVELISTLSIAIILSSASIPSIQSFLEGNSQTADINRYIGYLQYARSEAIKKNTAVMLCPSDNGENCTGGIRWDQGLIIYHDNNRNRHRDDNEKITLNINPEKKNKSVIKTTKGRQKLTYYPDGTSPGSNATITFCTDTQSKPPKAIIISNLGRPRTSSKSASGGKLNCII